MTDNDIIKDCPICGRGIEVVYIGGGWMWRHKIEPPLPICPITHSRKYATREQAIKAINKRADDDLINRQKAEIEQLKHKYDLAVAEREANVKGFTEQIEKLTKENEVLKTNNHSICLSMPNIAKAERAEAVKEFAERLKEKSQDCGSINLGTHIYYAVGLHHIDDLVKEFTEGG